MNCDVNLLW